MPRHRSASYKFEKNVSAEKAKLEARLADLNGQLAILNKARPKMALLRKRIRQIDAEAATTESGSCRVPKTLNQPT
jgi:hypothetical protein